MLLLYKGIQGKLPKSSWLRSLMLNQLEDAVSGSVELADSTRAYSLRGTRSKLAEDISRNQAIEPFNRRHW